MAWWTGKTAGRVTTAWIGPRGLGGLAVAVLVATAMGVAFAKAPADQYAIDTTKKTVHDTKTGLVWQRELDAGAMTLANAQAYCSKLELDGGGWRLPSILELASIVDSALTTPGPLWDKAAFPASPGEAFWSATPFAAAPSDAWSLYFQDGHVGHQNVANALRVRCVR